MLSQAPVTFFLHISSSGGTSVCRLAQEQPCARVPSCGANCNLNCRHPWDWRHHCLAPACTPPAKACRPSHKPGCGGLRRYAARHNLTFLSSETMLLEGPCPDFAYVTVPRPAASTVLVATAHYHGLLRLTLQAPTCVCTRNEQPSRSGPDGRLRCGEARPRRRFCGFRHAGVARPCGAAAEPARADVLPSQPPTARAALAAARLQPQRDLVAHG
jgi:hypothetical protein